MDVEFEVAFAIDLMSSVRLPLILGRTIMNVFKALVQNYKMVVLGAIMNTVNERFD